VHRHEERSGCSIFVNREPSTLTVKNFILSFRSDSDAHFPDKLPAEEINILFCTPALPDLRSSGSDQILLSPGQVKTEEISIGTTGSPSLLGILLISIWIWYRELRITTRSFPSDLHVARPYKNLHNQKINIRSLPKLNSFVEAHEDGAHPGDRPFLLFPPSWLCWEWSSRNLLKS